MPVATLRREWVLAVLQTDGNPNHEAQSALTATYAEEGAKSRWLTQVDGPACGASFFKSGLPVVAVFAALPAGVVSLLGFGPSASAPALALL